MKKNILAVLVFLFMPLLVNASFNENLYYGLQNNTDVKQLQEFLIGKSFLVSNATGNFFSLTLNAVKAYQISMNINSTGYVGTLTRTAINNELVINNQRTVPILPPITSSLPLNNKTQVLINKPLITILTPNGGEVLAPGQIYNITWTGANLPANSGFGHFDISLVNTDNGKSILVNGSDIPMDHRSYLWTVPNLTYIAPYGTTLQTRLKILIVFTDIDQITGPSGTYLTSTSANNFSIIQ